MEGETEHSVVEEGEEEGGKQDMAGTSLMASKCILYWTLQGDSCRNGTEAIPDQKFAKIIKKPYFFS